MITYKIKDLNGEIIEGIFYEKELQKTKNNFEVYIIEKLFEKIKTNTSLNEEIIQTILIAGLIKTTL